VSDPRARRSGPCGPPIPHRFRKQRRAGIKVPIKGLYSSHYYLLAGWLFGLKSKDP
jgi:hypothetical protein